MNNASGGNTTLGVAGKIDASNQMNVRLHNDYTFIAEYIHLCTPKNGVHYATTQRIKTTQKLKFLN